MTTYVFTPASAAYHWARKHEGCHVNRKPY